MTKRASTKTSTSTKISTPVKQTAVSSSPANAQAPDVAAFFRTAEAHLQKKEYEAAVSLYTQANHLAPTNIEITARLGIAYFKLGQYSRALRCFTAALRVPPKQATVFTSSYPYSAIFAGIGLVLERQERYEKAIAAYEKAISIGHPESEKLQQEVGRLRASLEAKPQFSYSLSVGLGKKMM